MKRFNPEDIVYFIVSNRIGTTSRKRTHKIDKF